MASLSEIAKRIRSKNAGPYWVTIDVFFENENDYQFVSDQLQSAKVANVLKVDQADLSRFDLPQISVIKFSFPRKECRAAALIGTCMVLSTRIC